MPAGGKWIKTTENSAYMSISFPGILIMYTVRPSPTYLDSGECVDKIHLELWYNNKPERFQVDSLEEGIKLGNEMIRTYVTKLVNYIDKLS